MRRVETAAARRHVGRLQESRQVGAAPAPRAGTGQCAGPGRRPPRPGCPAPGRAARCRWRRPPMALPAFPPSPPRGGSWACWRRRRTTGSAPSESGRRPGRARGSGLGAGCGPGTAGGGGPGAGGFTGLPSAALGPQRAVQSGAKSRCSRRHGERRTGPRWAPSRRRRQREQAAEYPCGRVGGKGMQRTKASQNRCCGG